MTWSRNSSGSHIPDAVVLEVRVRDKDRCQLALPGCTGWYQQLDHKDNLAALGIGRDDPRANDPRALQCVCVSCHKQKTQAEAMRGREWWKRRPERWGGGGTPRGEGTPPGWHRSCSSVRVSTS
jgi:hypothetical protein